MEKKEYNDRKKKLYNGKGPVDLVLLGGIYSKNYLSEKHLFSTPAYNWSNSIKLSNAIENNGRPPDNSNTCVICLINGPIS